MAHPDETRRKVRAAFVFDQQTIEVAALRFGIPVGTAQRWKSEAKAEGDDWNKAKSAQLVAGGGLEDVVRQTLGVVVQQVQATLDEIQGAEDIGPGEKVKMLASLADAYNKLMATSRRLMPQTDKLGIAMDVLKRLGEHIAKNRPALAGEFVEKLESFGEELAKAYGKE